MRFSQTGSRGEQGDEQSCWEGEDTYTEHNLCHHSLTLLQTAMREKHFNHPTNDHESRHGCFHADNRDQLGDLPNQKDVHSCTYWTQWFLYSPCSRRLGCYLVVHAGYPSA